MSLLPKTWLRFFRESVPGANGSAVSDPPHHSPGDEAGKSASAEMPFIAYSVQRSNRMELVPASPNRGWMNAGAQAFANRCLPMRLANQHGWFILNNQSIEVTWNGGPHTSDLKVDYVTPLQQARRPSVLSHFGYGLLTWRVPFVFRTPPGYNLYVRGPANWCKEGACPLDGIVEADWAVTTFTMNWKMTCLNVPVRFEEGEPIAMVFPILRGQIENFVPELKDINSQPELATQHETWSTSRWSFLSQPRNPSVWQRHYFEGTHPTATKKFGEHQRRLSVRPFEDLRKSLRNAVGTGHEFGCVQSSGGPPVCPAHEPSPDEGPHKVVEADFFHQSEEIARYLHAISSGSGSSNRRIWEYRKLGGKDAYFATTLDVLPKPLATTFHQRILHWATNYLGPCKLTRTELHLFISGCGIELAGSHSNSQRGLKFFLSLASRGKDCKGGEIILFGPHARIGNSSYRTELLPLDFNEFLAVDLRRSHGIRTVDGRTGTPLMLLVGDLLKS
jgi:hypothetical protein